jgi:hypothetical protein
MKNNFFTLTKLRKMTIKPLQTLLNKKVPQPEAEGLFLKRIFTDYFLAGLINFFLIESSCAAAAAASAAAFSTAAVESALA